MKRFHRPWRSSPSAEAPQVAGARPLYVFFDEAGDLTFSSHGTRHYLCGVSLTHDPWAFERSFAALREELFRGDMIPAGFHASEDRQEVRDRVFAEICRIGNIRHEVVVIEKAGVPTAFRDRTRFYTFMADHVLRFALDRHPSAGPVVVITDSLPVKRQRGAVTKGMKACLSDVLGDRRYVLEHQPSAAQAGLQVADYLNWAVFRRWERGDLRSYCLVEDLIERESGVDWSLLK